MKTKIPHLPSIQRATPILQARTRLLLRMTPLFLTTPLLSETLPRQCKKEKRKMKTQGMSEHLLELRSRILKALLGIAIGFAFSWFFCEQILDFISSPIRPYLPSTDGRLIFTSPFEKFFFYLRISLFAGFVLSCPFWLYQCWKFISPGLYKNEKKMSLIFVSFGVLLFLSGVLFVYFVVYPFSFRFLLGFGGDGELAYISLKPYLSFFIRIALVFGLVFETPLILSFLLKTKVLSPKQLAQARPYALVFIAGLSALVTPPDIFSMFFMMGPLYLLFELSILIGKFFNRKEKPSHFHNST